MRLTAWPQGGLPKRQGPRPPRICPGRVPAVIYGNKEAPQGVHVEEKALMKALMTGHFFNSVVMIDVGGKPVRTIPKDVQFHPVSERPLHADFLRI